MSESPVLPPLPPERLDEQQRELYDAILGGRAGITNHTGLTNADGALLGPFDPILRSPELGEAVQQLGLALRHRTSIPASVMETAILATAVQYDAEFEWYAHVAIVRSKNLLEEDDITRIHEGSAPQDEQLALAWRAARGVLAGERLSADLSAEVIDRWGERGLVEITCAVGHYSHLALLMRALGIEPPTS